MSKEDIIKQAYIKLRSAIYFEKGNLILQRKFVEFACEHNNDINDVLKHMIIWFDNAELINHSIDVIGIYTLPKKFTTTESTTKNYISNNHTNDKNNVERVYIFADIPIELHIVAVIWVLMHYKKIENKLLPCCKANRLAIADDTKEIPAGKSLYKPYFKQYQNWWSKAIDEANHIIENEANAYILSLDIQNYYHTVDFPLNEKILGNSDKEFDKKINDIFVKTHENYTAKFNKMFNGSELNQNKGVRLPIGLYSSPLLANIYLHELDLKIEDSIMPSYYGRYVDDILLVFRSVSECFKSVDDFIQKKMNDILVPLKTEGQDIIYNLKDFPTLTLQSEKISLYYFDKDYSTGLLSKFEAEQKRRSSEFRFISDDEDTRYNDEELKCFDNCFDTNDDSSARFKPQIENKYKLSCFLAKYIRRKLIKGKLYGKKDGEKIKRYFKGCNLINNYQLWEKLFVIYAVSDNVKDFLQLRDEINSEIDKIEIAQIKDWSSYTDKDVLKYRLTEYLKISQEKAINLLDEKSKTEFKDIIDYAEKFRRTNFIRHQYLNIFKDIDTKSDNPYDLHIYEKACINFFNYLKTNKEDFSYNIVCNDLKNVKCSENIFEIDSEKRLKSVNVAIVNKYVLDNALKESRRGTDRKLPSEEIEQYLLVLDLVEKTKDCNMFVMPELSLPIEMLPIYLQWSAKKQVAFIAGLEYINENKEIYNIAVACIPFEINHRKDCIPIFRLKKHYAPQEKQIIEKENFKMPKSFNNQYKLINWKGFRFSIYNCFELTSIKDRSLFLGRIDAIFAIAYNKDTTYYNNIVEATARDLHCYVIINNTSQYGDSQIIVPKNSDNKCILKVKGGTDKKNTVNVLVGELNLESLRNFQLYGDCVKNDEEKYKPLPAGYPIEERCSDLTNNNQNDLSENA